MPPKETVPPASVVIEVRLVVTPTVLANTVAPEVFTVNVCAPLMVEEKVILPEAELVSVVAAPKVTALPKVCTPLVLIEPPLRAVVPVLEFCTTLLATTVEPKVVVPVLVKEMLPSPCAPPTAPVKVMLPDVLNVRLFVVPLVEFAAPNVMFPPFVLVIETFPVRDSVREVPLISIAPVAVIAPPMVFKPVPLNVTALSAELEPIDPLILVLPLPLVSTKLDGDEAVPTTTSSIHHPLPPQQPSPVSYRKRTLLFDEP